MEELGLGLGLWQGEYEGFERLWLRWYNASGSWIPTKSEQIEQERLRADQERQLTQQERLRADQERQRAQQAELKLAALLQRLQDSGIDPSQWENG
jgi:phage terminase Nu1 subunit (DNA packaging protein)